MQAILNGLTGTGLLIDRDRVYILDVGEDGPADAAPLGDWPYFLGEARNVDFITVDDAETALDILRSSHVRQDALDLTLMLLDSELLETTRTEAAAVLNPMLSDWNVRAWLEGVLYGSPLPDSADAAGAIRHARTVSGTAVVAMLSRVLDVQDVVQRVRTAWISVSSRVLPPQAQKSATVIATQNGIFRYLVHASEGANYDEFRFAALRALQSVPNYRSIVEALIGELQLSPISRKPIPRLHAEDSHEGDVDDDRKDAGHIGFDRTAAFERVKRQQEAILNHMRAGRLALVERYVNELIQYQLPLDHRAEHTSKSLCSLAMEAKSLELIDLQLELATRAVSLRHQDGWAWAQVGDALLTLNRFEDALTAYRHAREFGGDLIGRKGYAQVLLEMGSFKESLELYEEVINDYPTDIAAKAGRAEVLKSMGRLDEALTAYEAVAREFPGSVVAKNGHAQALKSMGRLEDALADYEAVVREFPGSVVAENGRAEVLKSMGRLDEALAAYEAIAREYPSDIFAKTGRAEVLKSMGRLDDALTAYEAVALEFPFNVVAKTGRAEVLKSMGHLDEALAAYEAVAQKFTNDVVAKTGRAEVLKSMGRLDEALTGYEAVAHEYPSDIFAKTGRAEVLKSMGRMDEALSAYEAVAREFPNSVVAKSGRAEVLKSMGRLDEALTAYEAVAREFPGDVVAKNGHAEALKSMGRLDDALTAYEAVAREFPSNMVAKTGHAEVLKSMGRLDEALAAYEAVAQKFTNNVVAKSGRAEVLKSMGRLDEALTGYEAVAREYPSDIFAKTGRAEVLKSMGRLDEALSAYEAVAREFPNSVVAKTGRAEALKSMGRLDEALAAYEAVAREFPGDVVAKNGRAEVLKSMGRLGDALTAYDAVLSSFRYNTIARNGRATVLCALGKYEEVFTALPNKPPRSRDEWIAFHIRGMAMLRKRRHEDASKIFMRGSEENPFIEDRDGFRRGLALTRLHERAYDATLNILSRVRDIRSDRVAGFLCAHGAGALGDQRSAANFLYGTGMSRNQREDELKAELERRFIRRESPLHDEEWLIQSEIDCALFAA